MENNETYTSLLTIRARKLQLQKQLDKSSAEIKGMWNGIFRRPASKPKTPTQKFFSAVSSSSALIDGAILGWKLYRKFKKK